MEKFRFRQFPIYKDAQEFRQFLKRLSQTKFPKQEQFCLTSQLWRALDSIVLNIAEGTDRGTDKDFAHFLNIPHTSLNKVVASFDAALNDKYISEDEFKFFLEKARSLATQLTAFRKELLLSPTK